MSNHLNCFVSDNNHLSSGNATVSLTTPAILKSAYDFPSTLLILILGRFPLATANSLIFAFCDLVKFSPPNISSSHCHL